MSSPIQTNTILDAALAYAARGWRVIPLWWPTETGDTPKCACPRGAYCGRDGRNIGKHPVLDDWTTVGTTSPDTIHKWWHEWPSANIGLLTGGGLVNLDIDPRNGGDVSLEDLQATYEELPETVMAQTGGGGEHRLFTTTTDLPSVKLAPGIDFLADSHHQFVAAPSLHKSGARYAWELSSDPDDMPLAPLPAWVAALVTSTATEQAAASAMLPVQLPRTDDLDTLNISPRMRERIRTGAPQGKRSDALWSVLKTLIRAGYDDATIAGIVLDPANGISEKPLEQKNSRSPRYWEMTRGWVAKEIGRARAKPDTPWTPQSRQDVPMMNGTKPSAPVQPESPLPYSDYTNAVAFVADHGDNVRYCFPWGKWLHWQDTHWAVDQEGAVMRLAKQTIKRLASRVEHLDDEHASALMKHVKVSLSTGKLKAMVESAQSELPVPILPETLDAKPWLLNCHNGTLDLTSGILHPARREDYLTSCLRTPYTPEQDCPLWKHFLWQICDGPQNAAHAQALTTFLQHMVGYSLTGTVREQCLFILWGSGANGKSTFSNTLMALLHSYAMKASTDLLMVTGQDRHPTERTDLFGKRLVTAIETAEGGRLNEVFVKEATGGDPIRARRMREDFWEFLPTHKILLATNHKPTIRGTDHAIWRRIRLVPFTVTIPDTMQDDTLPEKLLTELPGILRWAVEGCLAWQREGLGNPDVIQKATSQYKTEMDVLGTFLEEICIVAPYATSRASALHYAYKQWCAQTGEYELKQRAFGMQLSERGFTRFTSDGHCWRGIGIKKTVRTEADPSDPDSRLNTNTYVREGIIRKNGSVGSVRSVDPFSPDEVIVFQGFSRQSPCPKCKKTSWSPEDGNCPVCMQCGYLVEGPL